MKKLKKLLAVLAFCACLVIPFTACGGEKLIDSYEYIPASDNSENKSEIILTVKNLPDLQCCYFTVDIYERTFTIYEKETLHDLLADKEFLIYCKGRVEKRELIDNRLAWQTDYEHAYGALKYVMIYKDGDITDPLNYLDFIEIITVE